MTSSVIQQSLNDKFGPSERLTHREGVVIKESETIREQEGGA